ncbi:MAG: TAXI family TRAP transporter solute-binding subunit [Alphaproteobacteria bacterium]
MRGLFKSIIVTTALFCSFHVSAAMNPQFFRIGTGGTSGTYYPIGGLIAHAISNPPGSRPCEQGGSCGVPGLVAIAQAANGSVANVNGIQSGSIESGFVQSDVSHWAYTGTGIYEGKPKVENLRAIANLYPESIHLVASKKSGIKSVRDLKGKRVSLDEPGSGTIVDARLILKAYGLSEKDIDPEYNKPSVAKIKDGQIDAFFMVAGYPTGAVVELASSVGCNIIPISGPEAEKLVKDHSFFSQGIIPAGTYEGVGEVKTVNVGAQWVVNANQDEELIYQITEKLWSDKTREMLDKGHAKGKAIRLEAALNGVSIPLHPGAERFYREKKMEPEPKL